MIHKELLSTYTLIVSYLFASSSITCNGLSVTFYEKLGSQLKLSCQFTNNKDQFYKNGEAIANFNSSHHYQYFDSTNVNLIIGGLNLSDDGEKIYKVIKNSNNLNTISCEYNVFLCETSTTGAVETYITKQSTSTTSEQSFTSDETQEISTVTAIGSQTYTTKVTKESTTTSFSLYTTSFTEESSFETSTEELILKTSAVNMITHTYGLTSPDSGNQSSYIGIICGSVGAVVFVVILILVIIKYRCRKSQTGYSKNTNNVIYETPLNEETNVYKTIDNLNSESSTYKTIDTVV